MNTRCKLEEARYFLDRLRETTIDPKINNFYLSAFLAAWRSVLDVLLYDLAEYYGIDKYYRKLPPPLNQRLDQMSFYCAVDAMKNSKALEFIAWWSEKRKEIYSARELSRERIIAVHQGLPPQTIIVPEIISSSGGFSLRGFAYRKAHEQKMTDIIRKCQEGFSLEESIVKEAERKFNINLD